MVLSQQLLLLFLALRSLSVEKRRERQISLHGKGFSLDSFRFSLVPSSAGCFHVSGVDGILKK